VSLTLLDLSEAKRQVQVLRSAQDDSKKQIVRAVEAAPLIFPFQGGADAGYRRLNQAPNERDLFPATHDRMQRVAYYLYCTNNIAARCVEIKVDFLCGEGVQVKAKDPAVKETLDEFWNDHHNDLDKFIPDFVQGHSVFGESLLQCYTNPISGKTQIAATDPLWIDAVEYATLEGDPGRAVTQPQTVVLRTMAQEKQQRRLRVIQPDENPASESYGQLTGECFYWASRKSRAATRGISDLFRGADLFDAHDQFLWAALEMARAHSAFIWQVVMHGATQEQIDQYLKDHPRGPRSGAVLATNDQVEWKAISPPLRAYSDAQTLKTVKQTIIAGFGYPEHWFADGGDANRATASEMGEPVLKMLSRQQRDLKFMLEEILRYVISAKIAAGVLPENVDQTFDVQMPELSVRDQGQLAAALQSTTAALSLAKAEGWVDNATAAKTIAIEIQQFGVEADADEMLQAAQAEKEQERARDFRNPLPPDGGEESGVRSQEPGGKAGPSAPPQDDQREGARA